MNDPKSNFFTDFFWNLFMEQQVDIFPLHSPSYMIKILSARVNSEIVFPRFTINPHCCPIIYKINKDISFRFLVNSHRTLLLLLKAWCYVVKGHFMVNKSHILIFAQIIDLGIV